MIKRWAAGLITFLTIALPSQAVINDRTAKPVVKATRSLAKASTPANAQASPTPVVLSAEQLAIAERVLVGTSKCELAVVVTLRADQHTAGRFVLEMGNKRYLLDPIMTSTGAVRLEEASSGAVWLQLGNKSMLMNQKLGQRMADDCMNPQQLLVAQALLRTPAPHLLDAPNDALVPLVPGKIAQEMVPNTIK